MRNLLHGVARRLPHWSKRATYRILETTDPLYRWIHGRVKGSHTIPPMHLRARVGKARSIDTFLQTGRNSVECMQLALKEVLGKTLGDFSRILDFGCGCGRTLLHLMEQVPAARLFGCDVDQEAIAWAQRRLRGDFVVSGHRPDLPFGDGAFDLVYAISVFTHLDPGRQLPMLQEVARVLSPGGVALITVHGENAYDMFRSSDIYVTAPVHRELLAHGELGEEGFVFVPYDKSETFDARLREAGGAYGLAFHHPEFLHAKWSTVLGVRGVRTAALDGFQDLVVLEKG